MAVVDAASGAALRQLNFPHRVSPIGPGTTFATSAHLSLVLGKQ